jgi:hypothetical protein
MNFKIVFFIGLSLYGSISYIVFMYLSIREKSILLITVTQSILIAILLSIYVLYLNGYCKFLTILFR